jgi:hypothetical protein
MKKWIFALLTSSCLWGSGIPQGQIDEEVLAPYLPLIAEELEKGVSLQDDGRTRRATREYGYSFFKMEQGDFSYSPPPAFLQEIGELVCQALGHEPKEFTNVILSLYGEGYSLEPHVDVGEVDQYPGLSFYFDENVYGIVIEPDPTGRLFFVEWHEGLRPPLDLEPVFSLEEKMGTAFCLQDAFRKSPFFHGVSPISNQRISLTFRTVSRL